MSTFFEPSSEPVQLRTISTLRALAASVETAGGGGGAAAVSSFLQLAKVAAAAISKRPRREYE
jgi:hypothetical protein